MVIFQQVKSVLHVRLATTVQKMNLLRSAPLEVLAGPMSTRESIAQSVATATILTKKANQAARFVLTDTFVHHRKTKR